jgi:antitoxin component YwqK of YwqJK toxin-antitoxin module
VKKPLNKKEYYVYALIDPRNNEYFYIGKGKGKRYNSHLNEKLKNVKNIQKFSRIKEIEAENLRVKIEILFPYLTEKNALDLEKIIIYKIGRESFKEGSLLNFVPGGVWSPGESIFYESKPNIDFNISLLDFVAQEKFHSIKKTSTIVHLDEINPKYFIYKYDLNGILISIDSIVCFFKDKNTIELFFEMNNEDLPIYFGGNIYSKKPILDFYFSKSLMSLNQHICEPQFLKKLDIKLKNKNDFTLELKQKGFSRIKVKYEKLKLKIETFYPNNIIQNKKYIKNGNPFGKWFEYYENGELKCITEYYSNGELFSRENYSKKGLLQFKNECFKNGRIKKTWSYYSNGLLNWFTEHSEDWKMVLKEFYYPNGELEYSYNNFKENIEYSYFNENGKLIEEFISDRGYIKYNLNKDIISISNTKHMTFVDPFKILTINQTKRMNDKMNEEEKRKSDEDWELYNNYLNNHN